MTSVQPHPDEREILRLTYVGYDGAEFDLLDKTGERLHVVRVNVGAGQSWRKAVRFPELDTAATASTGDDRLDQEIRERAAEELVRFDAATSALRAAA
jgi:hypothetical protein